MEKYLDMCIITFQAYLKINKNTTQVAVGNSIKIISVEVS